MNILSNGWIIAAAAAAAVFAFDLMTPLGYAVPMLHVLPILLTWMMPGRQSTILIAGSALLFIGLGSVLSPGELTLEALVNRAMASALLVTIAYLVIMHKDSVRTIAAAQQARNESEGRLRLAQSMDGFGTFEWDIAGQKIAWSPGLERIWGLPTGGFEGTYEHWRRLVHRDDVAEAERLVRLALDTPDISYSFDHRIIRPDGTVRWIHAKARTLRDSTGRPVRMVGVNLDITERKQTEEQLCQIKETLEQQVADRTTAVRASEARARADLEAMTTLQRLGMLSIQERSLESLLQEILDAAIGVGEPHFGTIQLLDPNSGHLKIAAQRGFPEWWVRFWDEVPNGRAACGTALERGRRVIVEDVDQSQIFTDEAARNSLLQVGVRSVTSTPLVNRSGKPVGMFSTHYKTMIRPDDLTLVQLDLLARQAADIIERAQADEALRMSEERFRAFTNATNDVVYRMSPDWTEMRYLHGRDFIADTLEPSSTWLERYIDPDDQPVVMATIRRVIQTKSVFELEHRVICVDGLRGWIYSRAIPIFDVRGEIIEWFGAASDITPRKRGEAEMAVHQSRLEDLTARLLSAQDDESRRIARELHDAHTQQLAALALDLHHLSRSLPTQLGETKAAIEQHARSVERLTTDLQQFAHQLHPSTLSHMGLEAILREHLEEFETRTGLKTDMEVRNLQADLADNQALCLFRVLQESLQNVRKHANASKVRIRLLGTRRGVGLCVHDDGRGFQVSQENAGGRNGLGLISMRERLDALNGTFRVMTKPGDGTEIHAWLPLEQDDARAERGAET